ncbi:MAG TPA: methyltransferase [Anaerolineales bacterium]|nr:methyltransferase [Anaerolineales bacterium]
MFKMQGYHYSLLILLLAGVYFLATDDLLTGRLWGIDTHIWFWIAVGDAVVHQIIVTLLWRAELYHQKMTEWFGDQAFLVYKVIFTILFVGRPITLILLAISNANTLNLNPAIAYLLAVVLFIPVAYTLYSVIHYFGLNRAFGEDHFNPEKYRNMPFVKQGMFKYTDNAMYKFAFLILWALAIVFQSKAALLVAAFSHIYIWVHFYFTELPDIEYIYGDSSKESI